MPHIFLNDFLLAFFFKQQSNIKLRKKLIKLAKENLHDPTYVPSIEQTNARDTLSRLVLASNFQMLKAAGTNSGTAPEADIFLAEKKMTESQTLLHGVITQMNYNDMKKQKIRMRNKQIWRILIECNAKSSSRLDKHIANVCKKYKIKI